MLLYVNKKKQKQRKIRITFLLILFFLFVIINICHFPTALNKSSSSLLNYQSQIAPHKRFPDTSPVTLLTPAGKKNPVIIVIPQPQNRRNITIIANAFAKIAGQTRHIAFTPEITNTDTLLSLLRIFIPECTSASPAEKNTVLITSDINAVRPQIEKLKLSPQTINSGFAAKRSEAPAVLSFINKFFPKPQQPVTAMEKEQDALQNFVRDNRNELLSVFSGNKPAFAKEAVLLKNARVCLAGETALVCSLTDNVSLLQNLHNARRKFPQNITPQKLYLLTSGEEVPETGTAVLHSDEGLMFRFGIRETITIPKKDNRPTADSFRRLKLQAGINPDYSCNEMKFYKFKTVEVDLHDKI